MNLFYSGGLDELHDWETGDFLWILAQPAYTASNGHTFLDEITDEVTVASYTRLVPANPVRTVDYSRYRILYSCDPPDFGDLEDTEDARWLILARDVTNDTDSPLICALDLGDQGIQLGDDFVVQLHSDGFAVDRQVSA